MDLKFEFLHENLLKSRNWHLKLVFLWKKNEIRKSYDTVPLIHNSIRVQTSFDRVLTVKNINFPPITAWSMCKNSESNYFPRFNTRKVITFRVLRRGK